MLKHSTATGSTEEAASSHRVMCVITSTKDSILTKLQSPRTLWVYSNHSTKYELFFFNDI